MEGKKSTSDLTSLWPPFIFQDTQPLCWRWHDARSVLSGNKKWYLLFIALLLPFKLQCLQPSLLHCMPTQIRVVTDILIGFTYCHSTFVVKALFSPWHWHCCPILNLVQGKGKKLAEVSVFVREEPVTREEATWKADLELPRGAPFPFFTFNSPYPLPFWKPS